MSDNVIDELVVKVGLDTSDYNNEVEKLAENNDKLSEGLEDVEKQFEKTTKATKENAQGVKNTDDSQKSFNTTLKTTENYLQRIASLGAGLATGMGISKWVAGLQQANDHLRDMAVLSGVTPQSFVKAGYMANAMGGDAESMHSFLRNLSDKSADMEVTGNPELLKALNKMGVSPRDANDKVKDPLTLFFELTKASDKYEENRPEWAFVMKHFGANDDILKVMLRGIDEVKKNYDSQDEKFILSDKDFQGARDLTKNMAEISNHFSSLSNLFATKLTPDLTAFSGVVNEYLGKFQKFAKENPELTENIAKLGAVAATAGGLYGGYKIGGKILGGGKGKGLSTIAGFADVQKVYVVNMGQGGLGGVDPKDPKKGGGFAALLRWFIPVGLALSVKGDSGGEAVKEILDKKNDAAKDLVSQYISDFGKDHLNDLVMKARGKNYGIIKDGKYLWENEGIPTWQLGQIIKNRGIDKNNPEHMAKYGFDKLAKFNDKVVVEAEETNLLAKKSNDLLFTMNGFLRVISDAVKGSDIYGLNGENNAEFKEKTNFTPSTPTKPITSQMAKDRMAQTMEYFMERGYTKNQAMGIAANLQAESGFDHKAKGLEKNKDGSIYYSKGIGQWNKGRLKDFERLFDKDIEESSFEEQLSFILWELENTEKGANKALKGSSSLFEAVSAFTKLYERPANADQRAIERANQAYSMMKTYNEMGINPSAMGGINPLAMGGMTNTSNINNSKTMTEVTIQSVVINTTASELTGIGQDLADGFKSRMLLGQLSGGMR